MNKKFIAIFILLTVTSSELMACPMCVGGGANDKYYLWVIGIFILLIYFPMFYLFKTFMKYKDVNKIDSSDS